MKRPKQHQIEDRAYRQFEECMLDHWVIRSQTHDYGVDREVEIFNQEPNGDAVSTGYVFKAQIKGTENVTTSKDDDHIKASLEVDRANYLCNELQAPVFFILVDVNEGRTWWYAIQLDKNLRHRLNGAIGKNQKTITLNIPTGNVLPNTLNRLVMTLRDIKLSHACDSFVELPQSNFDNLSLDLEEIADLEKRFTDKVFVAKSRLFWQQKDYSGLEAASRAALSNVNSSTATKISAILCIEKANENKVKSSPSLQAHLDRIYFDSATAIRRLTEGENRSWRLFSAIVLRAAHLRMASSSDFALYINRKIHDADGESGSLDFICSTILGLARQQALQRVFKKYNQCLRLVNLAFKWEEYWMIPQVVLRVSQALPPVFIHLWGEGLEETANTFRASAKKLLTQAVSISFALNNWDDMAQLVYTSFTVNSQANGEHYRETYDWARNTLDGIPDELRRKEWVACLEDLSQTFDPSKRIREFAEPDVPAEEEYQIYVQMAQAMGINFNDPNDQIAQIVRIGLQDLNPERVLKNCKQLFVYIGHYGIPAQVLGLHTAGSKYLRCLKTGVAIGGLSLDGIWDTMTQEHCSKCEHREPWPDDWKWTRSWQMKESEKDIHKKFRDRL